MFHRLQSRVMPGPRETSRLDTQGLRDAFLVEDLFAAGELRLLVTDLDRLAVGAAMPVEALKLPPCREFGTSYFTERREMGVVNLGETGHVVVSGVHYSLGQNDFLYIGLGNEDVVFEPCQQSRPCFYFLSSPAHSRLPVRRIGRNEVQPEAFGDASLAARRSISKFIQTGISCQLVMGMTELDAGSVWNTMPPHTHSRRTEIYLYCRLHDGVVMHFLGEPGETRHVVAADLQAVLSPSWSIHTGAGTRPYTFIWGMAGENQTFTDMDPVGLRQLR